MIHTNVGLTECPGILDNRKPSHTLRSTGIPYEIHVVDNVRTMTPGLCVKGSLRLFICLVILCSLPALTESQSDTIVVWSQDSHSWTRLRGIYGDPRQWVPTLQLTFVGSIPMKDSRWTAVAHDPGTGFLFWVDTKDGSSIHSQFATDNLLQTTNPARAQKILSRKDFEITGLAVDWNTGSVYFSEINNHFIGVTSTNEDEVEDAFRVVATHVDRPIGVAVMPVWRMVYWIDAGSRSIESCELDGAARKRYSKVTQEDVGDPLCMTLDHESQVLYWASRDWDNRVVIKKIQLSKIDPMVETVFALAEGVSSIASFQNYIYTLNSTQYKLDIYVNDKRTMDPTREYIIDAQANDLTIIKPQRPMFSECSELDCSQICMNINKYDGNYKSKCVCGHAYTKDVDQRSCTKTGSEGATSYIYSHGNSVWLARASIRYLPTTSISLDETPIQENFDDVRAVAGHVAQNLVFFGDLANGVIYRSSANGGPAPELTVNTRQVQGLSVDWLGDHLYWADETLGLIMCSKLDGRHHRVILDSSNGIGSPTFIAVDSARGKLFFISTDPKNNRVRTRGSGPKIMMANLDGTELETVLDQLGEPSGLTADPREYRLFWIERGKTMVSSVQMDGSGRSDVFRGQSYEMYSVATFQDIVTWTDERSQQLKFGMFSTGDTINAKTGGSKPVNKAYDVKTFDFYAQPDVYNMCGDNNGGCDQNCFHTSARGKPSTQRGRQCACSIGFKLDEDGFSCISDQIEASFLMFVDPYHKQVYQITGASDVIRREPQGLPVPYMEFPAMVEINQKSGEFVWQDTRLNQIKAAKAIKKKDKKEEAKTLWEIPNGYKIEKIALDDKGEYLYYTDSLRGVLGRMKMDGQNHVDFISSLTKPTGLIYHRNGLLFWTELGNNPKISMMKSDGTGYRVLVEGGLRKPLAIAVPEKDDSVIFWCDERTVNRMNITTKEVTKLHEIQTSHIISIATSGDDVYFSVWDEKGVYFLNDTAAFNPVAKVVTDEIFARITHMTFMSTLPAGALSFPVVPVAAGLAGAFVFLLLLGLLFLLLFMRRPKKDKKKEVAAEEAAGDDSYFDDPSPIEYANMPNENGGMGNGYTNGHIEPPSNGVPLPPPVLASESTYANTPPDEDPDMESSTPSAVPVMIPVVTTNIRRSKKPKELPAPTNDPTFEIGQREKVATRIQRLANRLRNRLSTIRWSGSPVVGDLSELPPDIPDAQPYTKTTEKKNYDYKPALHNLPRGFAPASHTVPRPVKDTWGRNKHNMAMKGEIIK